MELDEKNVPMRSLNARINGTIASESGSTVVSSLICVAV